MERGSYTNERGASKIRFGSQLLYQSGLRQRLINEISELESRMTMLDRSQEQKHNAIRDNYRNMILERLDILRDLLTD